MKVGSTFKTWKLPKGYMKLYYPNPNHYWELKLEKPDHHLKMGVSFLGK